jgi:hypothetical protein
LAQGEAKAVANAATTDPPRLLAHGMGEIMALAWRLARLEVQ